MQTMPAFLWNKRYVFISHRGSLILRNSGSSTVAAFVSNAESPGASTRRGGYNSLARGRLRLRQVRHAVFLAIARDAEIQIRIGQLGRAAHRTAMQRVVSAARVRFKPSSPG